MNVEDWIESIIKKEVNNLSKEKIEKEITIAEAIKDFEKEKDSWNTEDDKKICEEIDDIWDSTEEPIDEKDICETIDILHSEPTSFEVWENLPEKKTSFITTKQLLILIKKLGYFGDSEHLNDQIRYIINKMIIRKGKFLTDDTFFQVDIQKQVIAIAFNQYLVDPEQQVAEILGLNPNLFYAISGPMSTVVLLDTRRWVLEAKLCDCDEDELIWY